MSVTNRRSGRADAAVSGPAPSPRCRTRPSIAADSTAAVASAAGTPRFASEAANSGPEAVHHCDDLPAQPVVVPGTRQVGFYNQQRHRVGAGVLTHGADQSVERSSAGVSAASSNALASASIPRIAVTTASPSRAGIDEKW